MKGQPTPSDQGPDAVKPASSAADGGVDPRSLKLLSHDIRAAMSDVIGGLRLLEPDRLDAQTKTQIDRVQSAADTLAALVDHVLFQAAGERPVVTDHRPLILEQWLESMMDRWRGQAAEQRRTLRIIRNGPLPERVLIEPVALTRLVGNLVSNALRHTPNGDVDVVVGLNAQGALEMQVHDEGPGFPPEVLEGGRSPRPSATAGSGLGLNIVRSLSDELGIGMHLRNTERGGCVLIRLGAELLVEASAPDAALDPVSLKGLRVLVAEDNLTNQTILRHMLQALGTEADFVGDGRGALNALTDKTYDIALLDIEMPAMSGLEVMEQVRAMGGNVAATPLVAITAYVLRDNREAIYAAGADGIIGKPVPSAEDLGRAILRYVGSDLPPEGPEPPVDKERVTPDQSVMDRLLEAAGPDGRIELLRHLDDDLRVTLETMERAVAQEDVTELRAQTHILIAISGAVGADRLCRFAEALNIAAVRHSTERFAVLFPAIRTDITSLIGEVARRRAEESTAD